MISSKTLNIDNPKLNCRLKGYEKFSPKRIILDKNLEIKPNSFILKSVKGDNTIIFYNCSNHQKIRFPIISMKSDIRIPFPSHHHMILLFCTRHNSKIGLISSDSSLYHHLSLQQG